jgi:CAF1 family ribonuclease
MTGINIPSGNNSRQNNRPPRDEPPCEQYNNRLKQVPERYSIVQLGISLFEKVHPNDTSNENLNSNNNNTAKKQTPFVSNPRGYTFDDTTSGNRGYCLDPPTATAATTPTPTSNLVGTNQQQVHEQQPEWKVRRYNFYMFPDSTANREVVLNPGSISFLQSHNMSLDTWCSVGIPYVCSGNVAITNTALDGSANNQRNTFSGNSSNKQEETASILFPTAFEAMKRIKEYTEKTKKDHDEFNKSSTSTNKVQPSVESTVRRSVELTKIDDIAFFARTMAMIREWLDNPVIVSTYPDGTTNTSLPTDINTDPNNTNTTNTCILLPPCNSFLRRALYENINAEYPNLITENGGHNQIRVLRLSEKEKHDRFLKTMTERWNTFIIEKIGMWRIFAAISLVCRGYKIPLSTSLFAPSYQHIIWENTIDDYKNFTQQQQLISILTAPYLDITSTNNIDISAESTSSSASNGKEDGIIPTVVHRQCNPVPIIVHNGFMDLLFLMTHFCCTVLPNNLLDTKRLLLNHFPIIYDTKILATECWISCTDHLPNNNGTNLSNLYNCIAKHQYPYFGTSNDNASSTGSSSGGSSSNNTRSPGRCLIDLIEVVSSSTSKQRTLNNINSTIVSYGRGNTIEYASPIQYNNVDEAQEEQEQEDQEHEAAYDAYMTGTIFIGLCQLIWNDIQQGKLSLSSSSSTVNEIIGADGQTFLDMILSDVDGSTSTSSEKKDFIISRHLTGRNKLYQMSLYTLDLELLTNNDPLAQGMSRQSTYRVSGFDKSLTTADIVRCLSGLRDMSNRLITFEILWIDDTSFLAAAIYRNTNNNTSSNNNDDSNTTGTSNTVIPLSDDEQQLVLQEHGRIILHALETKFNKNQETVMSLDEYLMERSINKANSSPHGRHGGRDDLNNNANNNSSSSLSWMNGVLSFLGIHRNVENDTTNVEEPSRKRQRL